MENGKIQFCMDDEFEAILNEVIDGASDEINEDYEAMLKLWNGKGMEGQ